MRIDFSQILLSDGPFVTTYLNAGRGLIDRFETLRSEHVLHPAGSGSEERDRTDRNHLDAATDHARSQLRLLSEASCEAGRGDEHSEVPSYCVVASPTTSEHFRLSEPLVHDVFRVGPVPSLGTLIEGTQMVVPHAVLSIASDTDRIGMAAFGTTNARSEDFSVAETFDGLDAVIEALRFIEPAKVIVSGADEARVAEIVDELTPLVPDARIEQSTLDGSDRELLADEAVRSASSLAAERVAFALADFRAAKAAGAAVEGPGAVRVLRERDASSVLVHDDPDDQRTMDGGRLVDVTIVAALRQNVPIIMTPAIDASRGPEGGIGAITLGRASLGSEDVIAEDVGAGSREFSMPSAASEQSAVRRAVAPVPAPDAVEPALDHTA